MQKIKESESIESFTLPIIPESKTFKLSQYAEDISLYLKNGEQIANADVVIDFGRVSGLKLNINKTEGLWLGSLSNSIIKIQGIKWP